MGGDSSRTSATWWPSNGATAVLGFVYWAIATHLFSARDVGLAAAASSTALFLGAIGALGIPLLLLAELGSLPAAFRRVTFSTGMYISCLAALILSLGTLALSPLLGGSLGIIGAHWTTAALFVIGSVATMATLTFDNAAIGLHRGSAQLWRGSLAAALKPARRGCPCPRWDQNSPGPAVCLGADDGCLAGLFSPCFASNRPRPAKGPSAVG